MNVFFIFGKENKIVTPELTGTILEGVTRSSLIQLAKDRGMTVEERAITLTEWREGVANGDITEISLAAPQQWSHPSASSRPKTSKSRHPPSTSAKSPRACAKSSSAFSSAPLRTATAG